MKFNANVATIQGNAIFEETVKMSVQNESMPFIIKSLTDMYSNPTLALSREYLSNAYDACIAKMGTQSSFGTVLDTPIEVTLPSALNPNFVIRDYGIGMNREVLSTVFPQYGASTKRGNNNEIGGFGLGAKSALAIVANFTVVSIKDGKKNVGIVQKGADGVGEISFLPETETDEASGTTITITLPKPEALNQIFRDSNLLLGFPHGSILLNGKMHENSVFNADLYTKIGEDGWVMNSLIDWENSNNQNRRVGSYNDRIVVVGPISYHVSLKDLMGEEYSSWGHNRSAEKDGVFDSSAGFSVLNLPIGSVDFTPARENLIFSEKTRKSIIDAAKRVSKGVHEYAQSSIADAPSKREAARRADMLRFNGFELDWTYKGEKIPALALSSLRVEGKKAWVANRTHKVTPSENDLKHSEGRTENAVIVAGVKTAEQAKVLNRLRKPFADRYKPGKVTTETLKVLYMEAEKSELNSWTESLAMEVFTVEEWEAKGADYRKEINAERKAKRVANATTSVINYGSTPVSVLNSYIRSNSYDRPKVHSSYASEVATADTVIYFRTNNDAPESLSHKFAKTMSSEEGKLMQVNSLNSALDAVINHYSQDKKSVKVVRVPANTKVETFLKAVPHAISIDEAVKAVADSIAEGKGAALELLMAQKSHRYSYLSNMEAHHTVKIDNPEVRTFMDEAHKAFHRVDSYKTNAGIKAKSNFVFSEDFAEVFADFRKVVNESNTYPLPLLEDIANRGFKLENGLQYINLMYPVAA
jgi:hypothetical protein